MTLAPDPAVARSNVSRILAGATSSAGAQTTDELLPILYDELRALARARLAQERGPSTLQATALVHEAWLRLVGDPDPGWSSRAHFFGAAAQAMRRILVERARARLSEKRGGERSRVALDDAARVEVEAPAELIALDVALARLERHDPRKARIVSLRHFAGLSIEETARALDVSLATVKADWTYARAWLHREIVERAGRAPGT